LETEKFSLIKTEDGTETIYYNEYTEAMHSTSGAYEESLLKHIHPSGLLARNSGELNILDIGFGLGYNTLALIVEAEKSIPDCRINIVSFEFDNSYLQLMKQITFNDRKDALYKKIIKSFETGSCTFGNFSVSVKFGDARNSIKKLDTGMFDAAFQDPFSPSKNPELWSVDFFKELYRVLNKTAAVTTYSSAPQIRMAFLQAGFHIGKGPSVGKKREGTVAVKGSSANPLSAENIKELHANKKSTPYRDKNLDCKREDILKDRTNRIASRKVIEDHQAHQV